MSSLPSQLTSRRVQRVVEARPTPEGDGATVRRSIGSPSLRNLSPFLMLDAFDLTQGGAFPDHPHRGMSTVTLLLNGYVQHEDFAGHAGTIGPGDLQWMTAGRGIMHAEMPLYEDPKTGEKLPPPVGLQLWIDLPEKHKYTDPTYQEMKSSEIPVARPRSVEQGGEAPEREGQGWEIKVIAGTSHGTSSPVRSPSSGECWYFDITLQPGGRVFQPIPAGWTAFLFTLPGGKLKVGAAAEAQTADSAADSDDGANVYDAYHTLVLSSSMAPGLNPDTPENGVWLAAPPGATEPTRAVLIAGQPLDQNVVQMGPFVVCSREAAQETLLDFHLGRNGFERAVGWQSKIGKRGRANSFS